MVFKGWYAASCYEQGTPSQPDAVQAWYEDLWQGRLLPGFIVCFLQAVVSSRSMQETKACSCQFSQCPWTSLQAPMPRV